MTADWGARLAAERVRLGLTQREVAYRAGINRTTLIRWEKGTRPPTYAALRKVRDVFNEARKKEQS